MLYDSLSRVSAQSATNTSDFITYTDPSHGFRLKHPSDWVKMNISNFDAIFGTPTGSNGGAAVGIIIVNNPAAQNMGPDQLGKYMLSYHESNSSQGGFFTDFTSLGLNTNTYFLAAHPAYRLIYTTHDHEQNEWKVMETGTIIGNNIYGVIFIIKPSEKYQDYLPTAQQIVDSFQITNTNTITDTTNTTGTKTTHSTAAKPTTLPSPSPGVGGSCLLGDITTCFTKSGPSTTTQPSPSPPSAGTTTTPSPMKEPPSSNGSGGSCLLADITTCFTKSGPLTTTAPVGTINSTTPRAQQAAANFSQYQNSNLNFTVSHPTNWTVKENPQGVSFIQPQIPYARISVNVTENKTFGNMRLNDYTNIRINELRGEFKGFHLESENDTIVSGKQAHYLVFSFVKNSTVMAATTGYTIIGDRVYELGAIAPYTNLINIMPIFKTIRDSLNIQQTGVSASANTESNNQNQLFGYRG